MVSVITEVLTSIGLMEYLKEMETSNSGLENLFSPKKSVADIVNQQEADAIESAKYEALY